MRQSRRDFLSSALAISAGFWGLRRCLLGSPAYAAELEQDPSAGFGPLRADPARILDLPEGFSYRVISKAGEAMDDGLLVPGKPDGMAAFAGPAGKVILVRNHELNLEMMADSPYGPKYERISRVPADMLYDRGHGKTPSIGGCTKILYDLKSGKVERQYLALAGTQYNCAGGPSTWNSWITCEEDVTLPDETHEQPHGYAFDVPATADGKLVAPRPIKPMGRFRREAIAIDPASGVVYQTEDRDDGLIYRFIPAKPGDLSAGGRQQALAIRDKRSCDVRNWVRDDGADASPRIKTGEPLAVEWIDLDEIDAPKDDLRQRGFAAGAARFARGEGMWFGRGAVFFACTNGGRRKTGQVFAYTPSPFEGTPRESENPGRLSLFIEPNDSDLLENCDNVTIAPWGDLVLCEDADSELPVQHLVGVTPAGRLYKLARHPGTSEFAGSCFSPDGSTLFVNLQGPGLTLAITGPWRPARPGV